MTDTPHTGADLFIVDNSDSDWKVRNYLHDWTAIAKSKDGKLIIATFDRFVEKHDQITDIKKIDFVLWQTRSEHGSVSRTGIGKAKYPKFCKESFSLTKNSLEVAGNHVTGRALDQTKRTKQKYGCGLNKEIVYAVKQGIIQEPFSVADIKAFAKARGWDVPDTYLNVCLVNAASDQHSTTYKKYFVPLGAGQYSLRKEYR